MKTRLHKIILFFLFLFVIYFLWYEFHDTKTLPSSPHTTIRSELDNTHEQSEPSKQHKRIPRFTFEEFSLEDSPQEIIENAVEEYTVTTTFEVNEDDQSVQSYMEEVNLPRMSIPQKSYTEAVRNFFSNHIFLEKENPFEAFLDLRISPDVLEKEVTLDIIHLNEKNEHGEITFYYVTLPKEPAKLLAMLAKGQIVESVPEIFHKNYGKINESDIQTNVWMSNKEIALFANEQLIIVGKDVYDELKQQLWHEENK